MFIYRYTFLSFYCRIVSMFEKFTQKAIDIVTNAQFQATESGADKVYSEHLLIGLVMSLKGVQAKLVGVHNINTDELAKKIDEKINLKKGEKKQGFIPFSDSARSVLEQALEIAKSYGNTLVVPYYIALALFDASKSGAFEILKEFGFDEKRAVSNIRAVLNKKNGDKRFVHPEQKEDDPTSVQTTYFKKVDDIFSEDTVSHLLSSAKAKLSAYGYEILGTEQIIESVFDMENTDITRILAKFDITKESYDEKLKHFSNRSEEYGERQIIFTPNAFRVMLHAIEAAKEMGSVEVKPEHVVMGVLKAKTGIAYRIIKELTGHKTDLINQIIKELNIGTKTMPETLAILRLAKAEANNFNKKTIGTEMILLGILSYNNGVAAAVLEKLGIILKDARIEVGKIIGFEEEEQDDAIIYTPRAKRLLEIAYECAKKHGKTKIMSEHILYAITKLTDCVAMEVLKRLGADTIEIKQGILAELQNIII